MWRWVNPEKRRYYQADLIRDLFGDWVLVSAWGSLGSNRGAQRKTLVPSYEAGLERIKEIAKKRQQRGYRAEHDAHLGSPEQAILPISSNGW